MSRIESTSVAFYSNMADVETMKVIQEIVVAGANSVLPIERRKEFRVHLKATEDSDRWNLAILLNGRTELKKWELLDADDHDPQSIANKVSSWLEEWLVTEYVECKSKSCSRVIEAPRVPQADTPMNQRLRVMWRRALRCPHCGETNEYTAEDLIPPDKLDLIVKL